MFNDSRQLGRCSIAGLFDMARHAETWRSLELGI
jgi:hypothetical protein